ncbi:hypothetical protein G5V59_19045 [Nocardioides sp. W3-2-3]|uniref:hypothetical protein n=1 Tax=Nocardioides convexus TaxID=2712224 RepID=UPI00241886F4|nr:hypothetical protein [Nocardioides convexus]NHA01241.1 hypothetical protein [Nocardioides convexus]
MVVSGADIGKVREVSLEDGVVEADLALTDPDVESRRPDRGPHHHHDPSGSRGGRSRAGWQRGAQGRGHDPSRADRLAVQHHQCSQPGSRPKAGRSTRRPYSEPIDQASGVLEGSQESVGPALRGITDISRAIAANDEQPSHPARPSHAGVGRPG